MKQQQLLSKSIEERDGEICEFIRTRKDKAKALGIAATVFCLDRACIIGILQQHGLMDEQEHFVQPIRLTGKDDFVNKDKKIKYPDFVWSPSRKIKLKELYQAEMPVPDIAAHFGVEVDFVYRALTKLGITRDYTVSKPIAAPAPVQAPTAVKIPEASNASATLPNAQPEVIPIPPKPTGACIPAQLERLYSYLSRAQVTNNAVISNLQTFDDPLAMIELGRQDVILKEAVQIVQLLIGACASA